MARILGGDGGDELYGGNSRYARQTQFALYETIPAALRHALIEPLAARLPLTGGVALLRKARSYVEQASMPMPDRYESYNLLERLGAANVLEADFLAGVDRQGPLRTLRAIYAKSDAKSLINRMLALDFQITLADNDLPKVTRMCELAGIDVAFPMLHDEVIDFSLMLAPDQKLEGMQLRYFFKEALKDFLPPEVIAKEKHGFGLPFGVWLQRDAGLRALAGDTLATLRSRRVIRTDFIDSLLGQHVAAHAGYYGTMVWILMMLELWFQRMRPAERTMLTTPARRLKAGVKRRLKMLRHQYARTFRSFTPADLRDALVQLGIAPGDVVFLHSSFDAFAGFTGKATDVIATLQSVLGAAGTLLMPTLPFTSTAVEYVRSHAAFDVVRTPSRMGLLSELFRRSSGVLRSVHPTHPVAAWGHDAAAMIAGHHLATTPCGTAARSPRCSNATARSC